MKAGADLHCRQHHGPGALDETARRASHEELAVAVVLVAEGHQVRTVAEQRGARTPDLIACGTSVEVKAFQSLSRRGGRPPRPEAVANKLLDARGQGAVAVIWAGGSGLTPAAAKTGYGMFCDQALVHGLGRLRSVRMIGKGFDISLRPLADLRLARQRALQPARRPPARHAPSTMTP